MKTWMKIFAFVFIILQSVASFAIDADFTGYLRGGTGTNWGGGKQECFYNAGTPGNFLRLGNECTFYTELAFVFHHVKPTSEDPVYFNTQLRLEMGALGNRQWEAASNRDINQIEAFVEAGGFSEFPGSVWVGKRFYRDVDVNIFDWYYYADMSGVGAGVDQIPLGSGQFAFAHLIQANEDINDSSVGRPVLQALDLRWKNVVLDKDNKFNLWAVYAWAPRGTDSNGNTFTRTSGYSLSSKINSRVFGGNNNLAVMYGQGALRDLNIYGTISVQPSDESQNHASTWRFVNDWNHDVSEHWALIVAMAANYTNLGTPQNKNFEWQEIGLRPVYFFSDRTQLAVEGGFSRVKNQSERDGGGNPVGERTLARITIAPQLALSKSIWGRPVMRAFLSHSFWNNANKSFIAGNAPSFADRNEGTSFGYQFEVWF